MMTAAEPTERDLIKQDLVAYRKLVTWLVIRVVLAFALLTLLVRPSAGFMCPEGTTLLEVLLDTYGTNGWAR